MNVKFAPAFDVRLPESDSCAARVPFGVKFKTLLPVPSVKLVINSTWFEFGPAVIENVPPFNSMLLLSAIAFEFVTFDVITNSPLVLITTSPATALDAPFKINCPPLSVVVPEYVFAPFKTTGIAPYLVIPKMPPIGFSKRNNAESVLNVGVPVNVAELKPY